MAIWGLTEAWGNDHNGLLNQFLNMIPRWSKRQKYQKGIYYYFFLTFVHGKSYGSIIQSNVSL